MGPRTIVAAGLAASALGALPEYTPEYRDKLWKAANRQAKAAGVAGGQSHVCGYGTWGDSGQLNQWDQGFSPCWPSTMNVGATWDVELMARWSVEMAREFGEGNRGQLGPGVNVARYAWNGRLGEYMSGEDPYLGAKMIESQVKAYRQIDNAAVQTVKHWIPNTIEKDRNGMTEVVDERTLFEVHYPPFQAAVDAGVSAIMCSYNLINCTSGMCSAGRAYACANDDILNKHLKEAMGFKGIVMSDWDATHCMDEAVGSGGCSPGGYINNDYAAESGLDLEMPSCMTFSGGVSKRAEEKEARMRFAFLVQGRGMDGMPLGKEAMDRLVNGDSGSKSVRRLGERRLGEEETYCCWWPQKTSNDCAACSHADTQEIRGKCIVGGGSWCEGTTVLESPSPSPMVEGNADDDKAPTSDAFTPEDGEEGHCCWWPVAGSNICGACDNEDRTVVNSKCLSGGGTWCKAGQTSVMDQWDCSWLPRDNCLDVNEVACGCRANHPEGPCTPCNPTSTCKGSCCGNDCPADGSATEQPATSQAPPATAAPATETPIVAPPPVTVAPATVAPVTVAPATVAPATVAPATVAPETTSAPKTPKDIGTGSCCWWPQTGDDVCSTCSSSDATVMKSKCLHGGAHWCLGDIVAAYPVPNAQANNWQSGIYKDNPFGESTHTNPADTKQQKHVQLYGRTVELCEHLGGDNYKSPCKLDIAAKIIAESTVLLKNEGGVLPFSKDTKVAMVGDQACSSDPLAQAGGSGWNGFACNQVPKVNLKDGIAGLKDGPQLSCSSDGGNADVVVAMVSPEKASEGADRATLQLFPADTELIKKLVADGKKVVVVINAPGPMITSTWDTGVAAILISWLPGQQNGRGIAMALYGETHEASGRLPFTFPKCNTQECTVADERASVALGDGIENGKARVFSEKALVGYRWYHAKQIEVSYPFGFGLFAYGTAEVEYSAAKAATGISDVDVSFTMSHSGTREGHEVPQLYLSFPLDIPGDANSKPEWVLKGFSKTLLKPNEPTSLTFKLTQRDLSYWDDAPGRSLWVCAPGEFRACIGSNSRDAVTKGACTTFTAPCGGSTAPAAMVRDDATLPSQMLAAKASPAVLAAGAAALATLVAAVGGILRRQAQRRSHVVMQLLPNNEDTVE